METDNSSASEERLSSPSSPLRKTKEVIKKWAFELCISGLLLVVVGVATAVWKLAEQRIDKYIISALENDQKVVRKIVSSAVLAELNSKDSQLSAGFMSALENDQKAVRKIVSSALLTELNSKDGQFIGGLKAVLHDIRQTEAGTVSAGRFSLTPDENYILYVYFPEGYHGKITYQIDGEIIAKRRYVVLQSPNGAQSQLGNIHGTIDIPTHIKPTTGSQLPLPLGEDISPFLRDLRGFTFQLIDRTDQLNVYHVADRTKGGAGGGETGRLKVDVSYVAYVTPTIRINQAK
jgi:hypothetical protein